MKLKNGIRALIYDTEILTSFIPVYDKLLFMSKEVCAKEIDRMFEIDKDHTYENLSCEKKNVNMMICKINTLQHVNSVKKIGMRKTKK